MAHTPSKYYRRLNRIYLRKTGKLVFTANSIGNAAALCWWWNH